MAKHVQGSAVANATSYKLYNIGTGAELMTQSSGGNIDFDLSTLSLAAGTYSLAVKAFDSTGTYATSDFSNTVSYTVESDATTYIFSIDASPSSAFITLTASGYTTITGTGAAQITVANGTKVDWSASASGYITQNGTWTANGKNERKSVTLVKDEEPEEPAETTWYIDNAEQTGKTFSYNYNFPGAAARLDSIVATIRGVPINAVKFYPCGSGPMYFAKWVPGNMPVPAASVDIPVEDVYTTAPANGAGAKMYMLSETITLAADELLLCKMNVPDITTDTGGFWVNAGDGGDYKIGVWKTADNTIQNENWGLPFSIGYVK